MQHVTVTQAEWTAYSKTTYCKSKVVLLIQVPEYKLGSLGGLAQESLRQTTHPLEDSKAMFGPQNQDGEDELEG